MALSIIPRDLGDPFDPNDEHDAFEFERFGCDVNKANIENPFLIPFDPATHERATRQMFHGLKVAMHDGEEIDVWGFEDPDGPEGETFPSTALRFTQGKIVHSEIKARHAQHTIHHHGIEADAINDGVGHFSMEVSGNFTYQFVPRTAGTYIYHCHRNTVLHFILGMYGFLIVDPPEGPGRLHQNGPAYDVEKLMACTEIDPVWHSLDKDHGIACPFTTLADNLKDGGGLNDFRPEYFLINGKGGSDSLTDPAATIRARRGERVLVRLLNAGYTVQRYTFPFEATVHGVDGKPLGGEGRYSYSRPFTIPAGQPFSLTTARRWDLFFTPAQAGEFPVRVEYLHWITGERLGEAVTTFTVEPGGASVAPAASLLLGD